MIDETDDEIMLAEHAEDYRIEYKEVRPHEAFAWNRPKESTSASQPTISTFQATEPLPFT